MRSTRDVEKQWIFSPDTLARTPSAENGMPLREELFKRRSTIDAIRSLALRAKICSHEDPNHLQGRGVISVAATLVHRFYMRRSFQDFPEPLIAGTILFLASKIEEEPLKLRNICNSCLGKFDNDAVHIWEPSQSEAPPSREYKRWERDILAAEEIVLETLCFDMGVEQPWVILRRGVRGMDGMWLEKAGESSKQAEERAVSAEKVMSDRKGKARQVGKVDEGIVAELGWAILSEASHSPLCVLHPVSILAFATLVLIFALVERLPISDALALASELGWKFDLDVRFDESAGAVGEDLKEVQETITQFIEYCNEGLIDADLVQYLIPKVENPSTGPFIRRFTERPAQPKVTKVRKHIEPNSPRKKAKVGKVEENEQAQAIVKQEGHVADGQEAGSLSHQAKDSISEQSKEPDVESKPEMAPLETENVEDKSKAERSSTSDEDLFGDNE